MSRFIKLSNCLINVRHVRTILYNEPNKYVIKLSINAANGWMLFGSGNFTTYNEVVHVCKEKDPEDYNIIKKWILEN